MTKLQMEELLNTYGDAVFSFACILRKTGNVHRICTRRPF